MSTLLSEDERALRDAVRSYLDKKVAPLVAAHERARTFPWELLPQLYEFGYVRGGVPEAAGGDGLPMMMQAILMEEAGRCWGSLRTTVNVQGMVARVLAAAGDDSQAQRFLRPLLEGRRLGWFGLTEPDAGSDAGALRTTARRTAGGLVATAASFTSPTPSAATSASCSPASSRRTAPTTGSPRCSSTPRSRSSACATSRTCPCGPPPAAS